MHKCQHNEIITTFCLSEHCEWRQVSGCQLCIKKYHNHYGNSKFIQLEEILQIISKLSLQTISKPNCRKIQQSVYCYFSALKNEFIASLDLLGKNLINAIGSPYLTENKILGVYKKLKNKQYKRLKQKQFKLLYETTKKVHPVQISNQQAKLYKQQLQKSQQSILTLQSVIKMYQGLFQQLNQKFSHDKSLFESLHTLLKQTIKNTDLSINLSQFQEKQMEKNKTRRAQKQQKMQKTDTKKHPNQYVSILQAQYSSRLASKAKQKPENAIELNLTPSKDKSDKLHDLVNHKFGVKDFGALEKSDSQQFSCKRAISLEKKIIKNFSVQIPSKNQRKHSNLRLVEELKNDSFVKTQRHKITFPQRNGSIFNDIQSENTTKKPEQPFSTPINNRQLTQKENEISLRKQKLLQMMKNQYLIAKKEQNQKPYNQKSLTVDSNYHSLTNKSTIHQKNNHRIINNNSVLLKPTVKELQNQINPRKNLSVLFTEKIQRNQIKSMDKHKKDNQIQIQVNSQLPTSLSARLQNLKQPLQRPLIPSITNIPEDQQKSSQGSLQVLKKILTKKNMNAHPKLPIDEIEEKPKELACSRLIIVPTSSKFPIDKFDECDSPLLKKKVDQNGLNNNEKVSFKNGKKQHISSLSKQKKSDVLQNQQKSLSLLIDSIHLKPQQAIVVLQAALEEAPNNLSAAQYLSFLYLQNSKPKQTLKVCNLILDRFETITKENESLLINLQNNKSAALNMLGRYSEAIVLLQRCIKLRQKDTLLKNLADAYYFGSNYQKAVFYYEKAIRLGPNYDQAYYNMAVCLYLQKNFHNARQSILKAIEIAPRNFEYLQLMKKVEERIVQSTKK